MILTQRADALLVELDLRETTIALIKSRFEATKHTGRRRRQFVRQIAWLERRVAELFAQLEGRKAA